jgi:hypothetical protein
MAEPSPPQHTPIDGNAAYEAALDTILERAQKVVRVFEHRWAAISTRPGATSCCGASCSQAGATGS